MSKKSAGIVLYRINNNTPEFFLVHPGGPFWKNKDLHTWSIPKGEFDENENVFQAALREFREETGSTIKTEKSIPLTPVKQKGGKRVYAWGVKGDINPETIRSNTFEIEWPPKSGKKALFPEVDKGAWFDIEQAKEKINPAQFAFLEELMRKIKNAKE